MLVNDVERMLIFHQPVGIEWLPDDPVVFWLLLTAAGLKTALSAFPPGSRTHLAVQRGRPLQMNRCFRLNTFPAQVQEKAAAGSLIGLPSNAPVFSAVNAEFPDVRKL